MLYLYIQPIMCHDMSHQHNLLTISEFVQCWNSNSKQLSCQKENSFLMFAHNTWGNITTSSSNNPATHLQFLSLIDVCWQARPSINQLTVTNIVCQPVNLWNFKMWFGVWLQENMVFILLIINQVGITYQ